MQNKRMVQQSSSIYHGSFAIQTSSILPSQPFPLLQLLHRTTITLCFIVLWSGNFNLILKIDFQAPFVQFNFYFRFVCISSTTFRFVFPSFIPYTLLQLLALRYPSSSYCFTRISQSSGFDGWMDIYGLADQTDRFQGLPE